MAAYGYNRQPQIPYVTDRAWLDDHYEAPVGRPRWWRTHNCLAHPLLVIWPRVGEWLHDRTAPPDEFGMVDHGWHESGRVP